jgi:hypothetical protein
MDPLDNNGQKTRFLFAKSVSAFGHIGLGGSLGFAYLMDNWEARVLPRERCTGMVDAIYDAEGSHPGFKSWLQIPCSA